jgi:hypothetical protein
MNHVKGMILIAAVLAITSCTPPGDDTQTLKLYSEAALDGYVSWVDPGYAGTSTGVSVDIGDAGNDTDYSRFVISFDLASLPPGASIVSATLRVFQNDQHSGDSYLDNPPNDGLGPVFVDTISYDAPFLADADLLGGDVIGSGANIGTLATSFVPDTWHELDVTVSAQDEVSSLMTGRLQFRIYHHYDNDNDFVEDTDCWVTGDAPANRPELIITYE